MLAEPWAGVGGATLGGGDGTTALVLANATQHRQGPPDRGATVHGLGGHQGGWLLVQRLLVSVALVALAGPQVAVGAPAQPPAAAPPPTSPTPVAAEDDPQAAVAAGDLTTARAWAETTKAGEPTPEQWRQIAEICDRAADLACAREAWQRYRDQAADGSADREIAEARLAVLDREARGTVADEPASTQRVALDQARVARLAPKVVAPPVLAPVDPPPPPRQRIVKKWYFWVTVLAIAGTAVAITAVGIKASRATRSDDLDPRRGRVGPPEPGLGLRF